MNVICDFSVNCIHNENCSHNKEHDNCYNCRAGYCTRVSKHVKCVDTKIYQRKEKLKKIQNIQK